MREKQIVAGVLLACCLAFPARGGDGAPWRLDAGPTLHRAETDYFLAGIVLPRWDPALAEAADAFLRQELSRESWRAMPLGRPDRYGRRPAWLSDGGMSLQERLLVAGYALVDGGFADEERWAALDAAEQRARAAKRGIWRQPPVYPASSAAAAVGRYGLIDGVVTRVTFRKGHAFVDFGDDWRHDAGAFIPAVAVARFGEEVLAGLAGRRIRVRGWIEERHGPSVALFRPHALEILEATPSPRRIDNLRDRHEAVTEDD